MIPGIVNLDFRPELGRVIEIGRKEYQVQKVVELMTSKGVFYYPHVTCDLLSGVTPSPSRYGFESSSPPTLKITTSTGKTCAGYFI